MSFVIGISPSSIRYNIEEALRMAGEGHGKVVEWSETGEFRTLNPSDFFKSDPNEVIFETE